MQTSWKALFRTAAITAIVWPTITFAQDKAQGEAASNSQDIVVTAQRRSERLNDVPVAITAINAEIAQKLGVQSITDVSLLTPGVTFTESYTSANLYIRGNGTNTVTPGLEGQTAVYYDGAYLQRNIGLPEILDAFDAGTIQILRGPQGTLYGRNATAGVVILTSADPTREFEGSIRAEYGNFDHKLLEAMLNLPVSERLSLRVAGRYKDVDGFIHNRPDNGRQGAQRNYAVRAKALWEATDAVTVTAGFEYQHSRAVIDLKAFDDVGPTCLACGLAGITTRPGFYEVDVAGGAVSTNDVYMGHVRVDAKLGNFNLTNTVTYRDDKNVGGSDQDGTVLPVFFYLSDPTGGKTFTEEAVLTSDFDGPFNFLAGANYLHDKAIFNVFLSGAFFAPGTVPNTLNRIRTTSVSAFAEAYFKITDQFKATIGGRYTWDKRRLAGTNNVDAIINSAGTGATDPIFGKRFKFDAFTPRFVLAWDNGPTNIYYSYSRGFKSGGFFSPTFNVPTGVDPEKAYSHEVGVKQSDLLNGILSANLAVFYAKNKNLQTTINNISQGGGTIAVNAGAAESYGVEVDMQLRPMEGLTIGATGAYLHSTYLSFENALVKCFDPTPGAFPTLFNCSQNLKGGTTPRSPRWTASFFASYDFPLGDWTAGLSGLAFYQSKMLFYPGAGGDPSRPVNLAGTGRTVGIPLGNDIQKGYALINVSGYASPPGEKLRLGFFVNNLFDKKYVAYRETAVPFGLNYSASQPRMYGVRAEYRF